LTVKADWKKWNFRWRLKVDRVSIERMFAGGEFQVEGKEICIGRTQGSGRKIVRNEFRGREAGRYEVFSR